jgi:cytochrome P450 family 4
MYSRCNLWYNKYFLNELTFKLLLVLETAMGTKVDVQNSETSLYFHSVKEMCRIFLARTTSILKRYDSIFRFTKDYEIQKKSVEVLHGYTKSVINSKRKELEEIRKEGNYSDVDDLGRKKKKVFLDLILEATVDGQSLSDEEIREEVDTFMFGVCKCDKLNKCKYLISVFRVMTPQQQPQVFYYIV